MTPMPPSSRTALGASRQERLLHARLYLVVEGEPHGRPARELLEPAIRGGVGLVQLREKTADEARVVAAGREFRRECDRHGALLIVNDRPDLALACGADGVHLGQEDETVEDARLVVGPDLMVGVSTHSKAQIEAACRSSCDYIAVGPIHPTATKPDVPAVGLELVRHAAEHVARPLFAIGGLHAANVGEVTAAGATRIAVVRAIRDAADPEAAARSLREALIRTEAVDAR